MAAGVDLGFARVRPRGPRIGAGSCVVGGPRASRPHRHAAAASPSSAFWQWLRVPAACSGSFSGRNQHVAELKAARRWWNRSAKGRALSRLPPSLRSSGAEPVHHLLARDRPGSSGCSRGPEEGGFEHPRDAQQRMARGTLSGSDEESSRPTRHSSGDSALRWCALHAPCLVRDAGSCPCCLDDPLRREPRSNRPFMEVVHCQTSEFNSR
jgi:hypothetical protein